MSDIPMPQSPVEGRIQPGSHSGLSIQELPGMAQFQVIVRKGQSGAFSGKLASLEGVEADGLFICATGPGDYWVFSEKHDVRGLETRLLKLFGETASLFDQSHGRVVLRIEGPRAADVLAKGSPLDPHVMPASGAAHTVIEHIPALVAWRDGVEGADVSIPRSYAGSFMSWLAGAAEEFKYSDGPQSAD